MTRPPAAPPARVLAAFGLGPRSRIRYLDTGRLNLSWQVRDGDRCLVVRCLRDQHPDAAAFRRDAVRALAARGLPVVPTLPARDGSHLLADPEGFFEATPWVSGRHRGGRDLDAAECAALGALLARIHHALADALPAPDGVPPLPAPDGVPPPPGLPSPTDGAPSPAQVGSPADDVPPAPLRHPRARHWARVLTRIAPRPRPGGPSARSGWTHGDVQPLNLLWSGPTVVAVLDWDGLAPRPYADEVVRTATAWFGPDLDRTAGFTAGYRDRLGLPADELVAAVHRMWWRQVDALSACPCPGPFDPGAGDLGPDGLGPDDGRPDDGTPDDGGVGPQPGLADALDGMLSWWTAHAEQLLDAYTAGPP